MGTLSSSPRPERRVAALVALLVASFALAAALAWQAQAAAREHRATAERTLRDYAAYAALQLAWRAKEGIYGRASSVLARPADILGGERPGETALLKAALATRRAPACMELHARRGGPARAAGAGAVPASAIPASASVPASALGSADPHAKRFLFRLDLRTRELRQILGCDAGPSRAWLRDTLVAHAASVFRRTWDHADLVATAGGERWLVAYAVTYDDWDSPMAAFGFGVPFRDFARPAFADVVKHHPLLPPSLVGKTANDSLLSATVTDAAGTVLYRSAVAYDSPFSAEYSMEKFGGMHVRLVLRPDVASRLVIGGLPRSRLPQLLALLALAGGLVIVAILQIRREHALARLRADFVSNISHELRTPLAQVRMFAETLLLGRVRSDAERRRSLEIIDQEARRLTHLVENVLQFSRSERQAARISPEPTRLDGEVREAIEAFAPIAQARQVTVVLDRADAVTASVDRAALRQTLLNLLDNAVKYGPAGQTVRLALQRTGSRVRLTVDDGGPGIAAEDRERVWLPFYRLERDARSAIAGSGIGLAVVRDLISLHGGRVCVEDAPGGGARFVVELTCEPAADGADGVPAPARSPIAARDVARDAIRSPQPAL